MQTFEIKLSTDTTLHKPMVVAEVPMVPGVVVQGESVEEVVELTTEAVEFTREYMREQGREPLESDVAESDKAGRLLIQV